MLGGPVRGIRSPDTARLTFDVTDAFNTFVDCLIGGPPPSPTLGEVSVRAGANYSGAGKLCSVDTLSPNGGSVDVGLFLTVCRPCRNSTAMGTSRINTS